MKSKILHSCFYLFIGVLGFSQPIDAYKLNEAITLDGKLDEGVWDKVQPIKYKMQIPQYGEEPSEYSEVFLAYDEEYLYLAGRLHLSDPSYLRNTTYKRDAFDGTTDYFGLVIDSYLDKENGVAFFTTPTGLRWDGVVANDALVDADMSIDWNTFWDVATTHSDSGWNAEMRIPWSSLRFQDNGDEHIMGITSWWYIAAKNEVDIYPLIPLNWGGMSMWKPSQMQEFRFKNVQSKKPLYLAPYVLGGFQQSFDLNEDETQYLTDNDPTFEAGLDLKYGITSNLTLDLTVNTDFAQVEADDQQVNLTRFSLFFPEKRLFFQERASVFDFSFNNFNRLFYSRNIGINEDGDPVRIYGGARLVGRVGKFDLGFLNMQTQAKGELNAENFGLLRLRRQVFNQNSYVGGIFANRMDFEGNYNSSYGVDGIFRLFGDEYLITKWAQTFDNEQENEIEFLDPARIYINWERRRYDGFSYILGFSRAGQNYTPDIGFELRENYTGVEPRLAYGWLMGEQSKILRLQTFFLGQWFQNNDSKKVESALGTLGLEWELKSGWGGQFSFVSDHEFVSESFELGDDVEIPIGEYDFIQAQGFVYSPFGGLIGGLLNYSVGQFYDGNIISIGITPRAKLSSHLDLEAFYQYNRASFNERNLEFSAHVTRLKVLYMLNTKFSVASFLQYNSLDEIFVGNIRLRYNPKEGNDLYIVYNDQLNSNRARELPHLPLTSARTIVLKYTYTFQF